MTAESLVPSRAAVPEIWGNVPQRNKNFTGRRDLLAELEQRVQTDATAVLPQALHGLGGVGKTQLAIEYAYKYAGNYQIVWWVPADQIALIRSTLAQLAPRLGLSGIAPGRIEDAVTAVMDSLRKGSPYDRWLLIFDNADQPEQIREFMPQGPGHIIVTSRNRGWARVVDALEVNVFTRAESLQYLKLRVPGILEADADRLANELGDLPLALEQAAALLAETVMTVEVYLELLSDESDRIFSENPTSADYPLPVAAAWSLSVARLREQTPYAMELLQRCAFFGPAPIPLEMLDRGKYVLGPPLQETLLDPILMSRASRALGRYSLARIDNYQRTVEVHRIIQRLIRNELDQEVRFAMRHEVHQLLAASDPGDPDKIANWPKYAELLGHVGPSEVVTCRSKEARQLAQNIVRYLYITGNYQIALTSADKALKQWTEDSGPDDRFVLIMARLKAQVLRALGKYKESNALTEATFERMRRVLGEDHEETLILMNGRCVDLRAIGEFKSSLDLTRALLDRHRAVFGSDHPRTLAAMNNLAEDLELNSEYAAAKDLNDQLYEEKLNVYVNDNDPVVLLTLNALSRIMREQGHFIAAREAGQHAYDGYQDLVRQHILPAGHPYVLQQTVDFSAALRAAGSDPQSLELAQAAFDQYGRAFGPEHAATLAAAINLANSQRIAGDMHRSRDTLKKAEKQLQFSFGESHPYTLGCAINLSIANRRLGAPEIALQRLTEIRALLSQNLGPGRHPTLICAVNLASVLADLNDTAAAAKLGQEILPQLRRLLGEDHPHTLTCASNLSLDLKAIGETKQAADLRADVLMRYRRALGSEHPEVKAAEDEDRQDLGIEVPVLF